MNNYRILRLTSGDEIVCETLSEGERNLIVKSPLAIVNVPKVVGNDIEESLSLQRWVHFAETDEFDIDKSQVIVNTGASIGLQRFYEYVLHKLDDDEDYSEELEEMNEEYDLSTIEPDSDIIH